MNCLLKFWIAEAGFDPKKYGNESLRRTKALHILKGTGDLEMVRMLLGHSKIESTARFLRVPTTSDQSLLVEHPTSDAEHVFY